MRTFILLITLLINGMHGSAQLVFHNANNFPLLGKISEDTETHYERLPKYLKNIVNFHEWELGKNTAGLALRFRSNSTQIAAKWELLNDRVMSHMAPTGIKGLDLYTLENNKWEYVNTARPLPNGNASKNDIIVSNMESKMREYMLFLPLYDGVVKLEIGIDSLSIIAQPEINLPMRDKPIIFYGGSITQGCSASRPGMVHTNILTRWLNREVINLGFSSHGRLVYEIAEFISKKDASVIVLDCMGGNSPQEIEEKLGKFYHIIREKLPNVPIIFVDRAVTSTIYDLKKRNGWREKNEAMNKVFNDLIESGEKNIKCISSKGSIGTNHEATVDAVHYTDLGFIRFAEFYCPILINLLINSTLTN